MMQVTQTPLRQPAMENTNQTVSTNFLLMLTTGMLRCGMTEQQILDALQLDKLPQRHTTKRMPLLSLINHWHQAMAICKDPLLPIKVGTHVHPNDYNLIGTLILNCSTVEEAIMTGFQYEDLMSGCLPTLRFKEGNNLVMRISSQDYDIEWLRPYVEHDFASQIELGHIMTANLLRKAPMEVHFRHQAAAPVEEYERLLGVKVRFGMPYNQFLIPEEVLKTPVHSPCPELRSILQNRVEELHRLMQGSTDHKAKIESYILQNLTQGIPTLEITARHFNMSSATLKRKLAAEDTSYRQVCDGIRMSIAKQLLADPLQKVSSIAEQLDYSSPTAFISAFKRWTQLTPLQYRQRAN